MVDKIKPTVAGQGILDKEGVAKRGEKTREYRYWVRMLDRCYRDVYLNCSVSENFKLFSNFETWCRLQNGFYNEGWELGKDLCGNSDIYSEETCCFLPKEINRLITKKTKTKGLHPTGVSFYKRKGVFKADCMFNGKKKHLGYFNTPEDAFLVYKLFKEDYVKSVALRWKKLLDEHVFEALMRWEVAD